MNKLIVIHYYPIDYFPPVMNLINAIQEKINISVITTKKSNSLAEYNTNKARIFRPIKENKTDSPVVILIKYLIFTLFSLITLIRTKPQIILYYESISALAPYLYKKYINNKIQICIHYHEYMTPDEYKRPGMRLSKFNHKLEVKYLYYNSVWISQTNRYRLNFFLKDNPTIPTKNCKILPNYPPKKWHVNLKVHTQNGIIKCVYIGSLSLNNTYIKEFCEWIQSQDGKITFNIYSFNFHPNVKKAIQDINSPYIIFHEVGIQYSDIPHILQNYDIGILLYKGLSFNFKYNETNKFYEYLISGLDVWYPKEMTLLHEMDKSVYAPNILEIDFRNKLFPEVSASFVHNFENRVVDNSRYNFFSENIYEDFLKHLNTIPIQRSK